MKKISELYDVIVLSGDYYTSDQYSIEKQYDYQRYVKKALGFFDTFREDYEKFNSEEKTPIDIALKYLANEDFKKKYAAFIKENIFKVDIFVSKAKGKPKTFTDYKMTDFLIEFCNMNYNLNLYKKCMLAYKEKHNKDISNSPAKDISEMSDLNISLIINNFALDLLKSNPTDKKLHVLCKTWLKLLEKNVKIGTYSMEYVGKYYEVDSITPFTPEERKQMHQLYNRVNLLYNSASKKGDKENENVL